MTTMQLPDTSVALYGEETHQRVCVRASQLSSRRLVDVLDLAELEVLVGVLTGQCTEIYATNVWRIILARHNHAYVPLDDREGDYQHEPYATYRQDMLTVYRRLEAIATGTELVEDELTRYPDDEDEESANTRRLLAVLSWAAEQVNAVYDAAVYLDGETLLQQLEYDARFAVEHYFASEWFDDVYALGHALIGKPMMGKSAFGGYKAQTALIQAIGEIIIEGVEVIDDDSRNEIDRSDYGHRVALFWPLLKGIAYAAAHETNSPASGFSDGLLETIQQALLEGRRVAREVDTMDMVSRGRSESGEEVYRTPTEDVVDALLRRVIHERDMQAQFALMR